MKGQNLLLDLSEGTAEIGLASPLCLCCTRQVGRIVKVQACVRRWLVRHRLRHHRRQTQSAVTLQRYVRGWLSRKRQQEQQQLQRLQQKQRQNKGDRALLSVLVDVAVHRWR